MSFTPAVTGFESATGGGAGGGIEGGEIVTRTFNIHRFDPHPRKKSIIILGDLLVSVTSSLCPQVALAEDTVDFKKVINLEGLSPESNTDTLVHEIVRECPYIDPSLLPHLCLAIEFLKNREYDETTGMAVLPQSPTQEEDPSSQVSSSSATTPTSTELPPPLPSSLMFPDEASSSYNEALDSVDVQVDMASMESYVELLYEEDLVEKARGARCIAKLAKSSENLVSISYHETALNALFRTLREDYKKSIELTTHIMSVCLSYGAFTDFHQLLIANKICSLTFDLIEFELHRYDKWRLEVARRQDIVENRSEFPGSAGSYQKLKNDFEKMRLKFGELTRKQDYLLALAFEVILVMSENRELHREILGRGIVPMLMDTLGRKNVDLLKVVLRFLKNLSVFSQCKVQMGQLYVTEKVAQLLDANIPSDLVHCSLELLFNLSFDTKLRHKMVIFGILPKLQFYLEDSGLEKITRKLLYIMSMDRKIRVKFGGISSVIPILMRLHEEESRNQPTKDYLDILGILINLAGVKKCAGVIAENDGGLLRLLQQAFESEDEMVMKVVRNLSNHQSLRSLFGPFISDLARAIRDGTSEDFVLECIGTLANCDLPNIDFCKLLEEFQLNRWIHSVLSNFANSTLNATRKSGRKSNSNNNADERDPMTLLALEVIMLTGTCSGDSECVDMFIGEGVVELLIKILTGQHTSCEVIAQVLYVLYRMCHHVRGKQHIQEETEVPKIVLDLLQHEDDNIQQICEGIMNLFGENDQGWMDKLKEKRFRIHNEAWIEMTESRSVGSNNDDGSDEDEEPFGSWTYGNGGSYSKESISNNRMGGSMEMGSSASETLMTEDESGEDRSEIEEDSVVGDSVQGHNNKGEGESIFDRFKAQYEREMKAKESMLERNIKYLSDEDDDGEMSLIGEASGSGGGGGSRPKSTIGKTDRSKSVMSKKRRK